MNEENLGEDDYEVIDEYATLRDAVLNHIFDLIAAYTPDEVVIACDHKKSWRKKYYEGYKAQRKEVREKSDLNYNNFYAFLNEFILEIQLYLPMVTLLVPNLEGDDIIAQLVKTHHQNNDIIFVTADQDYYQLMQYDNVKMYDSLKKVMIEKTRAEALNDLKVKILMGDKSDNIPACQPKLGVKTAEKLLLGEEWKKQTLDDLMLNEEFSENFKRNTHLIDMNNCPSKLVDLMNKQLEDYEYVGIDKLFEYFRSKKLRDLLGRTSQISKMLKRVVSYHNGEVLSREEVSDFQELFSES